MSFVCVFFFKKISCSLINLTSYTQGHPYFEKWTHQNGTFQFIKVSTEVTGGLWLNLTCTHVNTLRLYRIESNCKMNLNLTIIYHLPLSSLTYDHWAFLKTIHYLLDPPPQRSSSACSASSVACCLTAPGFTSWYLSLHILILSQVYSAPKTRHPVHICTHFPHRSEMASHPGPLFTGLQTV